MLSLFLWDCDEGVEIASGDYLANVCCDAYSCDDYVMQGEYVRDACPNTCSAGKNLHILLQNFFSNHNNVFLTISIVAHKLSTILIGVYFLLEKQKDKQFCEALVTYPKNH